MSIVEFSTGRIQFISNDRQRPERNYSDRSLIELRAYDFNDYSLRALDIENNKEEIFNIPLKQQEQYQPRRSVNQPDEVRSKNGTYHLWLNTNTRDKFHEALNTCFELLDSCKQSHNDVGGNDRNNNFKHDNVPDTHVAPIASPKDLILDVYNLGKYIEDGNSGKAAELASQLATKGARLQTKPAADKRIEPEFRVNVQLDGNEYGVDQHGATIPMNVFPSTTIRELRAAFELSYQCPPSSQYFFVNGCLAHDALSMRDLNFGPNSLLILFSLTHGKTFEDNGPWKCSNCQTNNQENNLRCVICSAARTH